MYVEALFKNSDGDYYVVHYKKGGSDYNLELESEAYNLEKFNYKMVKCIITNNKEVSLKYRLKFTILEFRSLKKDVNYYGYDESLINRIGSLTSRLLRRGVDVTNEVALQCYDLREQRIRKQVV